MKKLTFFLLLLTLAGFSLFAQTYREGRIFIQPVTGTGQTGDNSYFFQRLTYETVLQYHTLADGPNDADYILRGTLGTFTGIENIFEFTVPGHGAEPVFVSPVSPPLPPSANPVPEHASPPVQNTVGIHEFFSWETDNEYILFYYSMGDGIFGYRSPPVEEIIPPQIVFSDDQEYIFILELVDSFTNEVLGRQYIIYNTIDASVNDYLSVIVYNMLSGIPMFEVPDDWRDQWLFLDVNVIWLSYFYSSRSVSGDFANFGFRLSADYHFTDFLSIGLGMKVSRESINGRTGITASLPISFKYVIKYGDSLMIEPYTGISFNYSIRSEASPLSWFAGCQVGIMAGSGMFTIDPRLSVDLTKSTLGDTRVILEIGIGYRFGYFPKRPSAEH